jgi:SET domain-containing protein|tara:strand:+ start:2432 stop:2737 length:306 start_codon:yes stop_codon:yes gene_type:complete
MSTYRPLPPQLTIKQSGIEGLGLFAVMDISSNTDLGLTHILDITQENGFIRTPLGGFINHSETPNLQILKQLSGNYHIGTLVDIKVGDELTLKYNLYTPKI